MKTYKLDIYPRIIWITIKNDGIDKFLDTEDFPKCLAQTENAVDKDTLECGYLIRFKNKKSMTDGIIAHEAVHAGIDICDDLGIKILSNNSEPLAYLVEWIVNCCKDFKYSK